MREKEKKLFDAIGDIADELVSEAEKPVKKKKGKSFRQWTALAAGAVLILGGLGFGLYGRLGQKGEGALVKVTFPKAYAFDDYETRREVRESNPVEEEFLAAIDEFTWRTAAEFLSESSGNANYSPLSLYYALSLAATGAKGETEKELLSLLGVSDSGQLSVQCGNLYRRLYTDNAVGKLKIANSLWLNTSVPFKEGYVKNAAENFYASSYQVDFMDSGTGRLMSKWVADNTNGKLQPEFQFDSQALMTILNTVYFKDEWIDAFQKSNTAPDTFYLSDGGTVECDFMNRPGTVGSGGFTKGDGFTSARLGLKNAGGVTFILPDEGVTPQELLAAPEKAEKVIRAEQNGYGEIVWKIPKFSFCSAFDMKDSLQRLGVREAFEGEADFSDITEELAYIDSVRQETYVSIDEKGVEAAAYTRIDYAGAGMPKDRAEMILNRPFIYVIHSNNGSILFVGICENPVKG